MCGGGTQQPLAKHTHTHTHVCVITSWLAVGADRCFVSFLLVLVSECGDQQWGDDGTATGNTAQAKRRGAHTLVRPCCGFYLSSRGAAATARPGAGLDQRYVLRQ